MAHWSVPSIHGVKTVSARRMYVSGRPCLSVELDGNGGHVHLDIFFDGDRLNYVDAVVDSINRAESSNSKAASR